jgi:hypothetical protein
MKPLTTNNTGFSALLQGSWVAGGPCSWSGQAVFGAVACFVGTEITVVDAGMLTRHSGGPGSSG